MLKRDHNSQQHDDRDKVASTPLHWHGMTNAAVSQLRTHVIIYLSSLHYSHLILSALNDTLLVPNHPQQ